MMLYTRKQMEREIDRRLREEHLRRHLEAEINMTVDLVNAEADTLWSLHKRVAVLEDRVRTLEYRLCPENVLTNTEVRE